MERLYPNANRKEGRCLSRPLEEDGKWGLEDIPVTSPGAPSCIVHQGQIVLKQNKGKTLAQKHFLI